MFVLSLIVLLISAATLGVAVWNATAWPRVKRSVRGAPARAVSVLIPARDEERNIARCLDAALMQGGTVGEVLVYDDHSTDNTAEIVRAYARRDARVRLVRSEELPAGWCGKNFACARLAAEARGSWLLFLDADARLSQRAAARAVTEAEARAATLLSLWPAFKMRGFWERALMPLLNFVVFTLYPAPLSFRRPTDPSLGLAHGACILARRDIYTSVGGHDCVRDALFEDVRLAREWRARGQVSLCMDGRGLVSVRMYRSTGEIWRGFQKNFFPAFRRPRGFWEFLALHFCVFLLPLALAPLALAGAAPQPFVWAALCVFAARAALSLRFGHTLWSILLHPLGEVFLLVLGLSSWWRCRTGRGVVWKGRRYLEVSSKQ